jgi:hypothetical protein
MATNIPLTLNYVVDETTPELEDPLLRTDVKKQLSKAAIRVNNKRNFLDKKTYNAYVVQSFEATTPAVHGTTIANIFEKIAALFPTNGGTSDIPVQCKAIVPDLHDSVIPIPDIIDDPSIITNGPYQKFLNMVPIFYAPPGQLLEVPTVGSIIEVEFNDNNYNEGRIIKIIKSSNVAPSVPSFPAPLSAPPTTNSSPPYIPPSQPSAPPPPSGTPYIRNTANLAKCNTTNLTANSYEEFLNSQKGKSLILNKCKFCKNGDRIIAAANKFGVPPAVLAAVAATESGGGGNPSAIRFETHVFERYTRKTVNGSNKASFLEAYKIDPDAAVKSTSFGIYQIMGFNLVGKGWTAQQIYDIWLGSASTRQEQDIASVEILGTYLANSNRSKTAMAKYDFQSLANSYNGNCFWVNNYDMKIKLSYDLIIQSCPQYGGSGC